MRAVAVLVASTLILVSAGAARAETTKTFQVTAVIASGCAVTTSASGGTWGNINLGTISGVSTSPVSASLVVGAATGVQVDCTPGLTANLTVDNGNQPLAGIRQMVHATNTASRVPYMLYANGSATAWTTQSIPLSFTVGASHQSLPVRAQATLSGPTLAGAYSDTVRVTMTW